MTSRFIYSKNALKIHYVEELRVCFHYFVKYQGCRIFNEHWGWTTTPTPNDEDLMTELRPLLWNRLTRSTLETQCLKYGLQVGLINQVGRALDDNYKQIKIAEKRAKDEAMEKNITDRYEILAKEKLPVHWTSLYSHKEKCDEYYLEIYEEIAKIGRQFQEADGEERRIILRAVLISNGNLSQNTEAEKAMMMLITLLPVEALEEVFCGLLGDEDSVHWFHDPKSWKIAMAHARNGKGRFGR